MHLLSFFYDRAIARQEKKASLSFPCMAHEWANDPIIRRECFLC